MRTGVWLGALVAAAALAAAGAVAARAAGLALETLHPRRLPLDAARAARAGLSEVSFRTADGLLLRGWYGSPEGGGAVIVLAHGWGATRQQMLPEAEILRSHGFGVLLFDFRAHGTSEGARCTSGDLERRDVEAALAFARRAAGAEAQLGVVAFSMGGSAAAEVAARDASVAAVVLEATPRSMDEDLRSDYPAWRPVAPWAGIAVHRLAGVDVDAVRAIDRLCAIAPRPLLLVYGAKDPIYTPRVAAEMLAAACAPKALWIVPGAGHGGFAEAARRELEERLVEFFRAALSARRAAARR